MESLLSNGNIIVVLSALLAVSEALALIPSLKSNSILTFIIDILKAIKKK